MKACAICRGEVDQTENWIKCHLWAAFGVFHWRCFSGYLRDRTEHEVEYAIWQASHDV